MTNLAKRRRALISAQGGAPPEPPFYINGYIGNGLIEYFDAIDNNGIGNPRSEGAATQKDAKHWLNYQGTNRPNLFEYGTNSWTADARLVQNWRSAMKWEYNFLAGLDSFTVEARFKQGNYSQRGCGFSIARADANGSYLNLCASQTVGYASWGAQKELPAPNGFNTLAVTCANLVLKFYINGELIGEKAITAETLANIVVETRKTTSGTGYYTQPGTTSAYQMASGAYTQRITVYNKELTAAELKANYQNDTIRFTT